MNLSFAQSQAISPRNGRGTLATVALALTLAVGVSASPAAAQDGTGAATPTPPSACEVVPAQVTSPDALAQDAEPTATIEPTPAASPDAPALDATPGASPVVDLVSATPAAPAETQPTPEAVTENPLNADLEASATAVAGCLSDANYDSLALITGDLYRGQLVGLSEPISPSDFTTLSITLPDVPVQILSVEDAAFTDDTTATATVTYEMAHQVRTSSWAFSLTEVQGTQTWVLESETAMAPELPANTGTIDITVEGESYVLGADTVSGPSVALNATNNDDHVHEVLVVRLEGDATTQTILDATGPGFPQNVTFVGQLTLPAGESGTLLLSGLQPGTYTIIDLLPNESGLPNLVDGMSTTFTVE